MENRRKRSSSGERFSFPSIANQDQDSDFEFGCFTPDLPCQDSYKTSPADHIFFNGRLLPHAFPLQPSTMVAADGTSRGTSRTSSINSKDSLMSSRSNSTNSRSSCSSARTSSSDNSERRLLYYRSKSHACNKASKMVTAQLHGDSQRWQYITQVPVLKRDVSKRKNNNGVVVKEAMKAKKQGDHHHHQRSTGRERSGTCLRFFQLFLLVCKQCHAMEPSRKPDAVQGNLTVG
ncbi:hypothetical protein PTKIN_Ptkin14bG0144200 [Pterospermum kingtungense]